MKSLKWQDDAECADISSHFFFPDDDGPVNGHSYTEARTICAQCPVITECLTYALTDQISHGMFGGLTPTERLRLVRAA